MRAAPLWEARDMNTFKKVDEVDGQGKKWPVTIEVTSNVVIRKSKFRKSEESRPLSKILEVSHAKSGVGSTMGSRRATAPRRSSTSPQTWMAGRRR